MDETDKFAYAIQALSTAANEFVLHASRQLEQTNPRQHQMVLEAFTHGTGDLRVTIAVLDEPPHLRLALHHIAGEEVLFDSVARLARYARPPGG